MFIIYSDNKDFLSKLAATVLIFYSVQRSIAQDFSYEGVLGPEHWSEMYQTCDGRFQSPINIDLVQVKKRSFPELTFCDFDEQPISVSMKNNGHTVLVNMEFTSTPRISGGPLNDSYHFSQFHFHWGDNNTYGSEDLINNQSFPIELHMVFYKSQYQDFNNALNYPDGLAVLAYFFELSNDINPFYEEFLIHLDQIPTPGLKTMILSSLKLQDFILNDTCQYFTYRGSLTTPPCSEVVTWIDFEQPIPISAEQIERFRNLYSFGGYHLTHNFRPVQPLNGRTIYKNSPQADRKMLTLDYEFDFGNDLDQLVFNSPKKKDDIDDLTEKDGGTKSTTTSKYLVLFTVLITLGKCLFRNT